MKSVLISIQPKWCELIASGKKTVEVRKTKPKIDVPFKCYIYCTQGDALAYPCLNNPQFSIHRMIDSRSLHGRQMTAKEREESDYTFANGKVIGEFVCDEIIEFYEETLAHDELDGNPVEAWMMWNMSDNLCEVLQLYEMEDVERCTCLKSAEILSYLHPNMNGYGWHISDLVIYDKPKELSEFFIYCGDNPKCDGCEAFYYSNTECGKEEYCCSTIEGHRPLKRPPQSWCYVEKGGAE